MNSCDIETTAHKEKHVHSVQRVKVCPVHGSGALHHVRKRETKVLIPTIARIDVDVTGTHLGGRDSAQEGA